ncbi:DNA processing protein [Corynebacterium suranareeae]|uniref:DNA processing protein n=1 Tax=Corynebacterium suranareeae TaxID=2506452 RepID=A0A160PT24_9CORY|nr:DNA-processing protein DprA [Corynebacterium suranareeae]BAU96363.1 DNA processing protein [Corynebacterium suranareeae]
MTDSRLLAWAYLSKVVEGPNIYLQNLLKDGYDPEKIAFGIKQRQTWLGEGLLKATESRALVDTAKEDLETITRLGGRLITPEDKEWPKEEFDHAFGFAASGMSDHVRTYQDDALPPHALWVRGGNLRQLAAQSVTIVGTRAISHYGAEVTREFTHALATHQWTIVSGGALGVDSVAHSEALRAKGSTIAVAACGLDRPYPSRNRDLFNSIVRAEKGVMVSEYPPGTPPQRHRFLTRNRLVAALSQGTVVIEAAWRSGALNTLSWCEGLGRVAMAVPGPVNNAGSLGCHERIRNGSAQMVTSADDVRSLLGAVGAMDSQAQYELNFAATPIQGLTRNELRVYDALDDRDVGKEAAATATEAGLTLQLTIFLLIDLQKRGIVRRDGTLWFRNTEMQ